MLYTQIRLSTWCQIYVMTFISVFSVASIDELDKIMKLHQIMIFSKTNVKFIHLINSYRYYSEIFNLIMIEEMGDCDFFLNLKCYNVTNVKFKLRPVRPGKTILCLINFKLQQPMEC